MEDSNTKNEWRIRNPKNEKLEPCLSEFLFTLDLGIEPVEAFDDLLELLAISAGKHRCLSPGSDNLSQQSLCGFLSRLPVTHVKPGDDDRDPFCAITARTCPQSQNDIQIGMCSESFFCELADSAELASQSPQETFVHLPPVCA